MTYKELLQSTSWKSKRYAILSRDHFTCTCCNNKKIIIASKHGKIIDITKKKFWFSEHNTPLHKLYEIKLETSDGEFTVDLYTYIPLSHDRVKYYELYYEIVDVKSLDKVSVNLITESVNGTVDVNYVRGLHVHHTYYQDQLFPWEYPDSSLITLCWICHKEFHSKEKVKYLDANGLELEPLTNCHRCGGTGYFPEYNHVEYGICFRCHGAKYEELIVWNDSTN